MSSKFLAASLTLALVLSSRGTQLESFVVTSLVQLLCRTTKLCWFDDDHFRTIVDDAKNFLAKGSGGSPVSVPRNSATSHASPAMLKAI